MEERIQNPDPYKIKTYMKEVTIHISRERTDYSTKCAEIVG